MPVPTWRPRLVALDLDETTVVPGSLVTPAVRRAVRRATAAGAHVVIATGRSVLGTLPVLDELGLAHGVALCSNGAVRLDVTRRQGTAVATFDPAPVVDIIDTLLPGARYGIELIGVGHRVTGEFGAYGLSGLLVRTSRDELVAEPAARLVAWWPDAELPKVTAALNGLRLPGADWVLDHSVPWLTVVPTGVSKGAALERLRRELGVPADATLAVGDSYNDLEMLRWAAHGVAMGQAPEAVRAAADEVTATVHEDGVAHVLERWFS
ncbi:MAG TPA: HAD family hydrolase [Pseudonocardiaceae bacterium]